MERGVWWATVHEISRVEMTERTHTQAFSSFNMHSIHLDILWRILFLIQNTFFGPEILHFQQAPRKCLCFWPKDHSPPSYQECKTHTHMSYESHAKERKNIYSG